jgi:hypothetical protein
MISELEQGLSQLLRSVLAEVPIGADIPDSERFRSFLKHLEWWIPSLVGEVHREFPGQALDGILSGVARKTGEGEAEILGLFCFLQDQTWTPFQVHLQVAASTDEISWLECSLGEQGENGMVRTRHRSFALAKRVHRIERKGGNASDLCEWTYKVTFGERRAVQQNPAQDAP